MEWLSSYWPNNRPETDNRLYLERRRAENSINLRTKNVSVLADFLTTQTVILHIIVNLVMCEIILSPYIRV